MSEQFNDFLVDTLGPKLRGKKVIFSDGSFLSSLPMAERLGITDYRMLSHGNDGIGKVANERVIAPARGMHLNDLFQFFKFPELQGWATERLDAWDPRREALVIASSIPELQSGSKLFGRETWGGRRPQWVRFEDKAKVDKLLFIPSGVPTPVSTIVQPSPGPRVEDAIHAFRLVNRRNAGAVISVGAEFGVNSAATGVRLARSEDDVRRIYETLNPEGRSSLRVAEFVPGISGSIAGMVFPDGTVQSFITFEHFMMVKPDGKFEFTGFAGSWRPDPKTQKALEAAVRRVGERMHATAGYVGVFDMDVIIDPKGRVIVKDVGDGMSFVANEVNSRYGGGPDTMARSAGIPWALFNAATISANEIWPAGVPDLKAGLLRSTVMDATIAKPWATPVTLHATERANFEGNPAKPDFAASLVSVSSRGAGATPKDHLTARYAFLDGEWSRTEGPGVTVTLTPEETGTLVKIEGIEAVVPRYGNPVPITSLIEPLLPVIAEDAGLPSLEDYRATFDTGVVRDAIEANVTQAIGGR